MTNPRRQVVRINAPGVGRMRAQNPDAASIPSRSTLNGAKMDVVKQDKRQPVRRITFSDTPYHVVPDDHLIVVDTTAGIVEVLLPPIETENDRILIVQKASISANEVTLSAFVGGIGTVIVSANSGSSVHKHFGGADHPSMTLIAEAANGNWFAIGETGTIT